LVFRFEHELKLNNYNNIRIGLILINTAEEIKDVYARYMQNHANITNLIKNVHILLYSETLELSWNIEPNRTEPNSIKLARISSIEANRIFSIFRCFFELSPIEPNS
jgi:hypothetical protein